MPGRKAREIDGAAFAADARKGWSTNQLQEKYKGGWGKIKKLQAAALGLVTRAAESAAEETEEAAGSTSVTIELSADQVSKLIKDAGDQELALLIRSDPDVHIWAADLLAAKRFRDVIGA